MKDFIDIDDQKNIVKCYDNYVFVKVFGKDTWKEVGFFSNKKFIIGSAYRINLETDKFSKYQGLGINKIVLHRMLDGDIQMNTTTGIYTFARSSIFRNMRLKFFSQEGYPEEYIIPLAIMTKKDDCHIRY